MTLLISHRLLGWIETRNLFERACRALEINGDRLPEPGRSDSYTARKRWAIVYYLRQQNAKLNYIAELVGRDRSTVVFGVRTVERGLKDVEQTTRDGWRRLLNRIENA